MKEYFLDTSFLVDLINERESALEKHKTIKGHESTGTPCIYELTKFTQFDPSDLFLGKEIYEFTLEDAKAAGNIYRRLCKEGDVLAEVDIVIAGMVDNRGLVLLTRDSDFERMSEIEVETY